MLDEELKSIVKRKVALDIANQDHRIAVEVAGVRREANARGMLNSSMTVLGIEQVHVAAMRDRVSFIWAHLHRCIETAGIGFENGLGDELKSFVRLFVVDKPEDLGWQPDQDAVHLGLTNMELFSRDNVQKSRMAALEHVFTEIDLYLIAMKKAPPTAHYTQQVVNINGSNVANFQTGASASATVTQNIPGGEYVALKGAFDDLRTALLSSNASVTMDSRNDAVDMIEESVRELGKAKPNWAKLAAFVDGIGSLLQGAVGLAEKVPAAFQSLKTAWEVITTG
jgi:hypothetical protein